MVEQHSDGRFLGCHSGDTNADSYTDAYADANTKPESKPESKPDSRTVGPVIFVEEGTANKAAPLDSVTLVRGPVPDLEP